MSHGLWSYPPARYWARKSPSKLTRLLDHHGWSAVPDPEQAELLLVGSRRGLAQVQPREDQLVDVVDGSEHLTHKGKLARVLRAAGVAGELQPETFLIDDGDAADPGERAALRARSIELPDAVWICKPQARGRGIGVEVVTDVEAFLAAHPRPSQHGAELVQRYIERPLLLEGTKSEVRSYLLIACTDPLLALYHDGTVRLTSLPFAHGDWHNPLIHVTNTYRQKLADPELYRLRTDALKWTLGGLGRDLLARGVTDDPAWVDHTLRPGLVEIARAVIEAGAARLQPRRSSFQLLGMDTIVSEDLEQLWLTEIQLGPGLSVDNPVKQSLIPSMLREALGIVLEVRARLARGDDPRQLESRRYFRWL